ncbi:hypothetical protein [Pseudomonas eucalypticola]|uniref:Uncharacterized protein n=1 Tax=Pseudomonas eucalypticola TaxID=2599595 RepID=A0A7D5H8Y9_9PSED|nr:hypothetical protein [Pseudomonas eucalypticola]QKZ06044.1 hypothetical protein HWQ56_20550 [Pseudomonas eucalypticola]
MQNDLTEADMRKALFGSAEALPTLPAKATPDSPVHLQTATPQVKRKAPKPFTPRLKVVLRVGNEFEGKTYEFVYEADTLSTLLAEQEAVRAARKKYRYVEVVSVKPM